MEVMLRIDKIILIFVLTSIMHSSCNAQIKHPLIGGVYVSKVLIENRNLSQDSIHPIVAFRIDTIINHTLLVKYLSGLEKTLDIDYVYDSTCVCYKSTDEMLFSPFGFQREFVYLKILDEKSIQIYYFENEKQKTYLYNLTYIDNINIATHRDGYYAEEGFWPFKD
jgi:hypothetical protein